MFIPNVQTEPLSRSNHFTKLGDEDARLQDRRRHHRFPANESAEMKLVYPMPSELIGVRVIDVSRGGMRIQLDLELAPGMIVEIRLQEWLVFAEVRHCLASGMQFDAGLQIQDVLPRSGAVTLPACDWAGN